MLKKFIIIPILALTLIGCANKPYTSISFDEGVSMMQENDIILDVRTAEEYNDEHLPNAVNIPNETIGSDEIKELPDKNQRIFIYCASGKRSKEAAEKLSRLGYKNIIEIGGLKPVALGKYYNDDLCLELREDNTYTLAKNGEEKDAGTWEKPGGLELKSKTGKILYFSVNNKTLSFNKKASVEFLDLPEGSTFILEPSWKDDKISMMSGSDFDFKNIDANIESITVKNPSIKDNIEEKSENDKGMILFRNNGRLTRFYVKGTTLSIITSDGKDEATIEAVFNNGEKKIFTVEYDCNCG